MSWSNPYIGIPYLDQGRTAAGCDCWGLARLIYADMLGCALPSYVDAYVSAEEQAELSALIACERRATWHRVKVARPFDLVLFRQGRHETHIGVALSAHDMIHIARGDAAKVERFNNHPRWSRLLVGAFRHHSRVDVPL